MHPLITLEEHYVAKALQDDPKCRQEYSGFPKHILNKLRDLGSQRIADMDRGEVSIQILSHGPAVVNPSQARSVNDELAGAIAKRPSRFKGFATLPMGDPQKAAQELERAVQDLGLLGALIDNHYEGRYYDDEFFWPIFAKAQELDTVLYVHPTFATSEMMPRYEGNYSTDVALMLSIAGFGWHVDTGLHILRLYASGVFDRFPKLKIIIGHMGELLPFQLERILSIDSRGAYGKHVRDFRSVWNENLWITTSGMFAIAPSACLIRNTKLDRLMYSVDYPFSANETGLDFLHEIRKSQLLSEEHLLDISYRNAERLFGIKA